MKKLLAFAALLLLSLCSPLCFGAPREIDPEESDFPPGLHAVYKVNNQQIERIDPELAFDWGTAAPDTRLQPGSFQAEWDGLFLIKGKGQYRFHAWLDGAVEVVLDDETVLKAATDQPQWVSGEVHDLSFGEKEILVRYRRTKETGAMKLFWSSEQFAIEPLPPLSLYREVGNPELALVEQGRLEYRAFHCDRCHSPSTSTEKAAGPSLLQTSGSLSRAWIEQKLTKPGAADEKMPHFDMTPEQARDISAYLIANTTKTRKSKPLTPKKADEFREKGELLARSTGCLACHVIDELGQSGLYGGGNLSDIGTKRTASWLSQWLKDPASLNEDHRMPVFQLSKDEQNQLGWYLSTLQQEKESLHPGKDHTPADSEVASGKKWISLYGCASCHTIPGFNDDDAAISLREFVELPADSELKGCLNDEEKRLEKHQPQYPQLDASAIRAWLQSLQKTTTLAEQSPLHDFQRGADLLIEKNCTACHPRDRNPGMVRTAGAVALADKRLTGQSQALIPPHLTAVGDRLQDDLLKKAIAGKQNKRLPWLSVRMPVFDHSEGESRAIMAHLIGHDRLPENVPDDRLKLVESELTESEALLTARELTGGRAFNCIACHKIGDYEPRNTAIGTRGSDLQGLADRLRPEYFLRWVRSPIRIVPGMEMPSYHQAKPGFPVTSIEQQLATLWRGFNNPKFEAPSNPAVVEQYLVVQPQENPRVIRDVFQVREDGKNVYLPRPLAAGFSNGHSIVFDLDQATLRSWHYGDFAFQQTEGKSWYWTMAGAPIIPEFQSQAGYVLQKSDDKNAKSIPPNTFDYRTAQLKWYNAGQTLRLNYEISFEIEGKTTKVLFQEEWDAVTGETSGFSRRIGATFVPAGYNLILRQDAQPALIGAPKVTVVSEDQQSSFTLKNATSLAIPFESSQEVSRHQFLELEYTADLRDRSTQPFPAKPEVEPAGKHLEGTPGFKAERLPFPSSIMPTAFDWDDNGQLYFTSLTGDLYTVRDSNQDGLGDELIKKDLGLSAPFGLRIRQNLIQIAHKPELLQLRGLQDLQSGYHEVVADGWGFNDNYHDWTTGFAEDSEGNLYIGTGSDYAQKNRSEALSKWRGDVLRVAPDGSVESISEGHRYPTGIASDPQGRIFTSDQQGVQNCFNEINHIVPGAFYGVPGRFVEDRPEKRASIQIPHPWTRSVNGIFFIPEQEENGPLAPFSGHGIGCEYNNRFLIRFSLQEVNGELQGACYAFTKPFDELPPDTPTFLGPLCGAVSPSGDLYIGSIYDSGWAGGQNTGDVVRMTPTGEFPNGIREVRATADGFEIEFLKPLQGKQHLDATKYELSGYTRVWEGSYATPDSGRYRPDIKEVFVSQDQRTVRLKVDDFKPSFVYEIHCRFNADLFPQSAYYTMNTVPENSKPTADSSR